MEEFEGAGLIASIIVSGIGFVFFSYGKKMSRPPQLVGGILLFVSPYLTPDSGLVTMLVGAALIAAIWGATRLGW